MGQRGGHDKQAGDYVPNDLICLPSSRLVLVRERIYSYVPENTPSGVNGVDRNGKPGPHGARLFHNNKEPDIAYF